MYQVICREGIDDFEDEKKLRTEIFMEEQGFEQEFDEIDPIALHVVIYDASTPIATGRTYHLDDDPQGLYHMGRICVRKDYRGKQIGALVMRELERVCRDHGGKRATLSAQVQASGFYRTFGYQEQGEIYLDEGCPHIQMVKPLP